MELYTMEDGKNIVVMTKEEYKEYVYMRQFLNSLEMLIKGKVIGGEWKDA